MERSKRGRAVRKLILPGLLFLASVPCADPVCAEDAFFTSYCQGCHNVTHTCAGCHAHGTHSSSAKNNLNLTGTTNKTTYSPGENVSVTISGGYRSGWVRAILYDQNMSELARMTGPNGMGGGGSLPTTLTAPAPSSSGTYTWNVAWYGNVYDVVGAYFGSRWTPDPTNPNHGSEIVSTNSFTVVPPAIPDINLNPASLNFGSANAGSTVTRTTLIENLGTAVLNVTGISRCAGTSPEYTWSPSPPFSVNPSSSLTLTVQYQPVDGGTDTGCLQISSNDPATPTATLSVTGTGVVPPPPTPDINLNPPALDFATVNAGESSTLITQVENLGSAALDVSAIELCANTSAEFSWFPSAPFTVDPSSAQGLSVTYSPLDAGIDTGCIQITSNDPNTPTVTLAVTGEGFVPPPDAPDIHLNPESLDFGIVVVGGGSATRTTLIENLGTAELDVSAVGLCSGTSSEFTWSPLAPLMIPAGSSVSLGVSYTPSDGGTDSGCLELTSNDPATPVVTLSLTGAGEAPPPDPPEISLNPETLDFGGIGVGGTVTLTTLIANLGASSLHISSITPCGGTSLEFSWSPEAPLTIPESSTVTLNVAYSPLDAGNDFGCLEISSDDPISPVVWLDLIGSGTELGALDLDIKRFGRTRKVLLSSGSPVYLKLVVVNGGTVDGTAPARIVGVQDEMVVYDQTLEVTARPGKRAVKYWFPVYTPTATGIVTWTATISDGDPDVDTATAITKVLN